MVREHLVLMTDRGEVVGLVPAQKERRIGRELLDLTVGGGEPEAGEPFPERNGILWLLRSAVRAGRRIAVALAADVVVAVLQVHEQKRHRRGGDPRDAARVPDRLGLVRL